MKYVKQSSRQFFIALLFLIIFCILSSPVLAKDVHLDATYTLAANGDLNVVMKLTTSMDLYQKMRQSIANLYLLLRNLASQRAELEVEDKKADWDDSARTITISYKVLGMARNLGNHWEFDIPQISEFSNLDEDQRTVYFTEEVVSPLGTVRGKGKLILPENASQYKWEGSRRVVSYVMPEPQAPAGKRGLLLGALVFLVLGLISLAASFAGRVKPPDDQLPAPPKLLND